MPALKRPNVGAAPAGIIAPISLRRVRGGEAPAAPSAMLAPPPVAAAQARRKGGAGEEGEEELCVAGAAAAAAAGKKKAAPVQYTASGEKGDALPLSQKKKHVAAVQPVAAAAAARASPPAQQNGAAAPREGGDQLASWLLIDNAVVPLDSIKDAGPMKLTCFAESSVGKEFAIGFRDERPLGEDQTPDLLCAVVVDGTVYSANREIIRGWKDAKHESADSLRPFIVSPLPTISDADLATVFTEAGLKALGTVELRIWRGRVGEKSQFDEDAVMGGQKIGGKSVWEESKKVQMEVAHQAGLGEAMPYDNSTRSTFEFDAERWDAPDKPWITFEFKYRDKTTLEIEGHLPTSRAFPSPPQHQAAASPSSDRIPGSSSSRASSARAVSTKPKPAVAREDSPDVLIPREPTEVPPEPPKQKKKDVKGKGKAREQPGPLGVMVLPSSPPPPSLPKKISSTLPRKPPALVSSSSTPASSSSTQSVESELAALRAELAAYRARESEEQKKAELEKLRRERDEVRTRVERAEEERRRREVREALRLGKAGGGVKDEDGKGKEMEKERKEMVLDYDDEDEDDAVVAGQLLPPAQKEGTARPTLPQKRPSGERLEEEEARAVKKEKKEVEVLMLCDSDSD
ncbi:hypothetical protein JCM8547_005506 [Rhodosporidiobolus lusitaniae]